MGCRRSDATGPLESGRHSRTENVTAADRETLYSRSDKKDEWREDKRGEDVRGPAFISNEVVSLSGGAVSMHVPEAHDELRTSSPQDTFTRLTASHPSES